MTAGYITPPLMKLPEDIGLMRLQFNDTKE